MITEILKNLTKKLLRKKFGFTYTKMGLFTDANCDFIQEDDFKSAYSAAIGQWEGVRLSEWVLYTVLWVARQALKIEGDFVECGTYRGCFAKAILTSFNLGDKKFYLVDTYKGLDPAVSTKEELDSYKDAYPDCYEFVKESFKNYSNVVIVRGSVPSILPNVQTKKVAYLSIDMNSAKPELEALKYFWDKLTNGGIVLLDDYACAGHIKQKQVIDDFCLSVGVKVLSLPTGQGIIIKS